MRYLGRHIVLAASFVCILPGCAAPREHFDVLLQRELNSEMRHLSGKHYDGIRGFRVVDGGIEVILDSRYLNFEDTKETLGLMLDIELQLVASNIIYASRRTGYHVDPAHYMFFIEDDRGDKLDRWSLAHVENDSTRMARSVHVKDRTFNLDMKSWEKDEAKLPASASPAPLIEPHDFCADADALLKTVDPSSDPHGTLKALHDHIYAFECVSKRRSYVQATWNTAKTLAEHAEGDDSDAAQDAALASQQFMKCSGEEYGTPEGAGCQTLGMKLAELQAHLTLRF